jgi:hypothetical protein
MWKIFIVSIFTILLVGCAGQYNIIESSGNMPLDSGQARLIMLDKNLRAYVTIPQNGKDKYKEYPRSGKEVAEVIQSVFATHLKQVNIASSHQDDIANIQRAKQGGFSYLIDPTINEWSDNYTFWTGVPDKVSVGINIFDVATGDLLDHFTINSTSSLTPSINQKPYDLLYAPLNQISAKIFKSTIA